MTNFVVATTVLLCIIGVSIAVWSLVNTRNKYYRDYISKKRMKK